MNQKELKSRPLLQQVVVSLGAIFLLLACSSCEFGVDKKGQAYAHLNPMLGKGLGLDEDDAKETTTDKKVVYSRFATAEKELHQRGKYMFQAAACGSCHASESSSEKTPQYSGGRRLLVDGEELVVPNITPSGDGIADWSIVEVMNAIRGPIAPDERELSEEVHEHYRWMSNRDARAIAFFLLSLDPLEGNDGAASKGVTSTLKDAVGLTASVQGYIPELVENSHAYSKYLVERVARCQNCHTAPDELFKEHAPYGGVENYAEAKREFIENGELFNSLPYPFYGPGIRGSVELAGWSNDDLVRYLTNGNRPDGSLRDGRLCPWPSYDSLTKDDKLRIAEFILSL